MPLSGPTTIATAARPHPRSTTKSRIIFFISCLPMCPFVDSSALTLKCETLSPHIERRENVLVLCSHNVANQVCRTRKWSRLFLFVPRTVFQPLSDSNAAQSAHLRPAAHALTRSYNSKYSTYNLITFAKTIFRRHSTQKLMIFKCFTLPAVKMHTWPLLPPLPHHTIHRSVCSIGVGTDLCNFRQTMSSKCLGAAFKMQFKLCRTNQPTAKLPNSTAATARKMFGKCNQSNINSIINA